MGNGSAPTAEKLINRFRAYFAGERASFVDVRLEVHRAAGTFCARNRFGIVVPCHRVVASDGLGSYGSLGPDYKQRLLALEGVTL